MHSLSNREYQPVVIIGAGRSGTNMLRDLLTQLPGFGTWPCDEINYIWRHGNVKYPTDEFPPDLATPKIQAYILQKFTRLAEQRRLSHVVEKTCANSLRVSFVDRILPKAWFIHIVRDGRDVVASAIKRWQVKLELPYIMRKARYIPLTDLPYYAARYLWNMMYRFLSPKGHLAFWGPRFAGMEDMIKQASLAEVCAIQWQCCVERAARELRLIDATRVHTVRYEDIVAHPEAEGRRLGAFLQADISAQRLQHIMQGVTSNSVGKWKQELDLQNIESIVTLVQATLKKYGYE